MIDEPPAEPPLPPPAYELPTEQQVRSDLPETLRADGTLVIDLSSLAPPPTDCVVEEPDPLNPEIVVCRETLPSPRLGADYGPTADEVIEGSAVPRASVRLSDDAVLEANVANNAVGGFNANGGEVRVKIDF